MMEKEKFLEIIILKRICITNKDIGDGKKSVFFHEMVHCLMSDTEERKLDFITKSLNEDYEYKELRHTQY